MAIMTYLFERGDYTLHQAPFAKFHFGTSCFQLSMARLSSDGLVSGNGSRSWCCCASLDVSAQGKNMSSKYTLAGSCCCRVARWVVVILVVAKFFHPEMRAPRWLKHLHSKGSLSSCSENHGRNRYKVRFRQAPRSATRAQPLSLCYCAKQVAQCEKLGHLSRGSQIEITNVTNM